MTVKHDAAPAFPSEGGIRIWVLNKSEARKATAMLACEFGRKVTARGLWRNGEGIVTEWNFAADPDRQQRESRTIHEPRREEGE